MRTSHRFTSLALVLGAGYAASSAFAHHPMSGGDTTIVIPRAQATGRGAFGLPAPNLALTRRGDHFAGNSFFQNAWVTAPASVQARDGLGPLFNTMSCQSCHIKDGRGRPPKPGEAMVSMLVRSSVPPRDAKAESAILRSHGVVPEPVYGGQIQNHAIAGQPAEAEVHLDWTTISGTYADGTPYELRSPTIRLEKLGFGPLAADVQLSGRVAPALVGAGLLDTIPEETLAGLADPDDVDGDGVSGRLNRVWDVTREKTVTGRFGWKAEQPDIRQQVAAAFVGDVGITSSLFPEDGLTPFQRERVRAPDGGTPEVSDEILDLVTFYCKTLAVPAQRGHDDPVVLAGARIFRDAGCTACHVETLRTGDDPAFPELSNQEIHPYTDLLLHDMGEGLSDDRPTFAATGREWRTPPLWGIGLVYLVNRHTNFLHDGRARNLEEAILWHGGEAERSREHFRGLPTDERRKLIVFLKSL